jgi:hypothetical protein
MKAKKACKKGEKFPKAASFLVGKFSLYVITRNRKINLGK